MTDPEPTKKGFFEETKVLGAVIGVLVLLYVGITAWVMLTNQKFGSTQLGFSALHTSQLKVVQDAVVSLSNTAVDMKKDQEDWHMSMAQRLNRLDSEIKQLSTTVSAVSQTQQEQAKG